MQEPLSDAGRDRRCRAQVSRAAHPGRQHRAGLVLVEHDGRTGVRQNSVSGPKGHGGRPTQAELPPDDLRVAVFSSWIGDVRGYGPPQVLYRSNEGAVLPPRTNGALRRVQSRSAKVLLEADG